MGNTNCLTEKQRRYVQYVASGMDSKAAAKAAGYSDSFAKVAHYRLQKKPAVASAIEAILSDARREAKYTLLEHVKELDWAIAGSAAKDNWMAVAKNVENKGRCFGFYVDRVAIVPDIQLRDALLEARGRVFGLLDITPKPSEVLTDARGAGPDPAKVTADGSPRWKPLMD